MDADACPVINEVEEVAKDYKIPVCLISDTNHLLTSDYSDVVVTNTGTDAVDFALLNRLDKGDVVVTRDNGLAAMASGKGAYAIHHSGRLYVYRNLEQLFLAQNCVKTHRKTSHKGHTKGTRKRTYRDNFKFEMSFRKLIVKILEGRM